MRHRLSGISTYGLNGLGKLRWAPRLSSIQSTTASSPFRVLCIDGVWRAISCKFYELIDEWTTDRQRLQAGCKRRPMNDGWSPVEMSASCCQATTENRRSCRYRRPITGVPDRSRDRPNYVMSGFLMTSRILLVADMTSVRFHVCIQTIHVFTVFQKKTRLQFSLLHSKSNYNYLLQLKSWIKHIYAKLDVYLVTKLAHFHDTVTFNF